VSELITRDGAGGNGLPVEHQHEVWGDRMPFKFVKDDKVIVGKDDWLFLDNDSNGFLRQYAGELRLSEQQLDQWQQLLETRIARLAEMGIRYHFMVVPENPTVYPEMLPDHIEGSPERTVHQLINRLRSTGSPASVIYPIDELKEEKLRRRVCRKTDTHWTDYGAFVGYRRLSREIEQQMPIHRVSEEELWFFEADLLGDLGYKLGIGPVPEPCTGYLYARARGLYDNCIESHGSRVDTECAHAPATKCMVFGDSACYGMLACLAQSFGRMTFVHSPTLDYDLIAQERPTVVVSEMAERFLILVPDDSKAKSVRQFEDEKRAAGRYRPRVLNWDPSQVMPAEIRAPTVGRIETARARFLALGRLEDATFVAVMAYAGLTPREALCLSWQQVTDHSLTVEPAWSEGTTDADRHGRRTVPLLGPLADDLAALREAARDPDANYVFAGLRQRDWDQWIRRDYRRAIKRAGQPNLGPGSICDGFAALLIQEGASPSEVAQLMGIGRDDVARRFWYLLEAKVPNVKVIPAEDRIREARAAAVKHTRRAPPGAATLSRLWQQLLPHAGPRTTWEDSLGTRPLPVETVERIRARFLARGEIEEALFVSVMAYAGLAQQDALPLKWKQIKNGAIEVRLEFVAPESQAAKILRERSVPLIETLAQELEDWRIALGSPELGLIFPNLRQRKWQDWVRSDYQQAAKPAGRGRMKPHFLCHTFASILIGEGRSATEVARQTGLPREEVIAQYAHLFEEASVRRPLPADTQIREARAALSAHSRLSSDGGVRPRTTPSPVVQEDS
jgi:alginate O-acetyltransferase complex protein AlgJ